MNDFNQDKTLLNDLVTSQKKLCDLIAPLNNHDYRHQFHPDLSPLGWHLGHTVFVENFWLHETILNNFEYTANKKNLYVPSNSEKSARGAALPAKPQLLKEVATQQQNNAQLLDELITQSHKHPLIKEKYLLYFLLQHHAMHIETMCSILSAKNLRDEQTIEKQRSNLNPAPLRTDLINFETDTYPIGSNRSACFDNEKPKHHRQLPKFAVNQYAVSNGEYLSFINDGGYQNKKYWCAKGWQWRKQNHINAPNTWRYYQHEWIAVNEDGIQSLAKDKPVYGVSLYEAKAFAQWAKARLPHEYELEVFQRSGLRTIPSKTWEWCDNLFHPYKDYRPFPYKEYSLLWFDNKHHTLKGESPYAHPLMQRSSFRNFYTADRRHTYTGIRLAFNI